MQNVADIILHQGDVERMTQVKGRTSFIDVYLEQRNVENDSAPRVSKSHHMPEVYRKQLEEGRAKFIVVVRNPKDLFVSFYHFYRMNIRLGLFPGTWDEFFELVRASRLAYGDYFDWYRGWWLERRRNNVLFVKYEDAKKVPVAVIKEMSAYLGQMIPQDVIEKIAEATSFKNVSGNNEAKMNILDESQRVLRTDISDFFRKGSVGDWKQYFSREQSEFVDRLYKEKLEILGLKLDFE